MIATLRLSSFIMDYRRIRPTPPSVRVVKWVCAFHTTLALTAFSSVEARTIVVKVARVPGDYDAETLFIHSERSFRSR